MNEKEGEIFESLRVELKEMLKEIKAKESNLSNLSMKGLVEFLKEELFHDLEMAPHQVEAAMRAFDRCADDPAWPTAGMVKAASKRV
jgi:hypothetical protein